ncbi:MAG: PilZ domain-containing protein [Acidobacteriaceae bacterium]
MHRFHYRYPRFSADFPAQFAMSGETIRCRCTEISVTGMKVEFTIPLAPGSCGQLSFHHQSYAIGLNARVAHATSSQSGLEFLDDQHPAHGAIVDLVDSLPLMREHRLILLTPRPRVLHGHALG